MATAESWSARAVRTLADAVVVECRIGGATFLLNPQQVRHAILVLEAEIVSSQEDAFALAQALIPNLEKAADEAARAVEALKLARAL